jgi:hypothetical protein
MRYTTLLVSILLLIGCTNQQNNDQSGQNESTSLGAATLEKAAQKRIQYEIEEGIPRRVGGRISSNLYDQLPFPTAFRQYLLDHRDEIEQTFKVVQVDSVRDYGVALYRFSIGSNIIRGNYEMARYDSLWHPASVYLGSDEKESLPPDILRRYEEIQEKRVEWMENSTPIFPQVELFK